MADRELHSEKIRKLLDVMPQSLTIWGVVVITTISVGLAIALFFLPYPYSSGESILEHLLK